MNSDRASLHLDPCASRDTATRCDSVDSLCRDLLARSLDSDQGMTAGSRRWWRGVFNAKIGAGLSGQHSTNNAKIDPWSPHRALGSVWRQTEFCSGPDSRQSSAQGQTPRVTRMPWKYEGIADALHIVRPPCPSLFTFAIGRRIGDRSETRQQSDRLVTP